jgi:excisionase family DNA binding protein
MPNLNESLNSPRQLLPLDQRASLSPGEWCALHGIGRTTLYQLWREGRGPDYFIVGKRRRIPRDALPKQASEQQQELAPKGGQHGSE